MSIHASITNRITLIFGFLSALVMISIGAIASYSVQDHFAEEDLAEIKGKLELIQHAFKYVNNDEDLRLLPRHLDDALVGHHALAVEVYDDVGQIFYRSEDGRVPEEALRKSPPLYDSDVKELKTWTVGNGTFRGLSVRMPVLTNSKGYLNVAIAVDIGHHDHFIWKFQRALWIYLITGLLFLTGIGWLAARRGLRPIRDLVKVAKRISASRLNERIQIETLPAELVDLAVSFNEMLKRLEDSFRRLSEFSSDIAHELRTPVSNLMTQSQVALSHTRNPEEYQEVLYSNIEEYERLSRMIGDMLFLAKADNGLIVPHAELMKIESEIDAVIEFYEALASEKSIQILREGQASISGDRLMMRRVFSNLLSNAIRYTPVHGRIQVTVLKNPNDTVTIDFDNPGAPIPVDALERVFDRFYRVDPSRQRQTEGTGLGLPISKSIIHAHGGTLTASNIHDRVRFRICLPNY